MEIELPDGTVLDAPEGADIKKVVAGYNRSKLKASNPSEYDPESDAFLEKYGPVEKDLREGIGSGMTRMNRGLGNLANKAFNMYPAVKALGGIDLPNKEYYGDEAIRDQDKRDSPLSRTTKGRIGQTIGQSAVAAAATAPLGGIGGLSSGGGVLTRTLAAPTTRAALEGAVGGAAAADPDQQGRGAAEGATASVVANKLMQGAGRTVRGLVKKNEATRDLEDLAGQSLDIPLSQAASDEDMISRGIRGAYQEALPNVLGVKGRIARQSKEAQRLSQRLAGNGGLGDELIDEVFSEPAARGSRTGRILTSLGIGGIGVYGSPMVPVVTLLGGNLAATKVAQRALMGDTAAQRQLANLVEKNPNMASQVQQLMKSAAATEAGQTNGEP